MKKLLIVLVLIGVTAGAFAQDVFASYNEPGNFNIYASVGWAWNLEASVAAEWMVGEFALGPLPFDWGIQVRGAFDIGYSFYFGAGALASLHLGIAAVPIEFYAALGICYNSWSSYFVSVASYNGVTWWFTPSMGLLVEGGYLGWGFWGVGLEFKI
jgi:hypothetical protein